MTFSTIPINPFARRSRRVRSSRQKAFTLTEVIIGATLSVIILAGVMTTFLMLGRSGAGAANYSMSESEIRRAIEVFSQDVRMATNVTWNSDKSITLEVPTKLSTSKVTYAYDNSASGPTAKCFYRMPGDLTSTSPKIIYVRSVSDFEFKRFDRLDNEASNELATKRVQITFNVRRTRTTLVAANTVLVSASYILRNKAVH